MRLIVKVFYWSTAWILGPETKSPSEDKTDLERLFLQAFGFLTSCVCLLILQIYVFKM